MTGPPDTPAEHVLVVDPDSELTEYLAGQLRDNGFETSIARDGYQALAQISRRRPDLVLMEVELPLIDGLELTRQLRGDPMTASLPVIIVTCRGLSADRIAGLTVGADDYVVKPFDAAEVVARVRSALRRHREIREVSPLTGLPGNARILAEIAEWVRSGEPFALCYVDINQFKSVNDAYGFVRGDEFIQSLAGSLHRAALAAGPPHAFIGHVGGDDFIIMCDPLLVAPITRHAIAEFETRASALCDPHDAERGYIESHDRQGRPIQAKLPTLSIGVALSQQRHFTDPREAVAVATEMKSVAKSHPGSHVAYDRRHDIRTADLSQLNNLRYQSAEPHQAAWQHPRVALFACPDAHLAVLRSGLPTKTVGGGSLRLALCCLVCLRQNTCLDGRVPGRARVWGASSSLLCLRFAWLRAISRCGWRGDGVCRRMLLDSIMERDFRFLCVAGGAC